MNANQREKNLLKLYSITSTEWLNEKKIELKEKIELKKKWTENKINYDFYRYII